MYFDYYFSQVDYKAFYKLPKRSTSVDQNFISKIKHSQLSVAIFRVLRNLLVVQNDAIY